MSIEDNLENSKEQLIRNIALLNDSINKNSNEIDKNKLIVLLIEKYNINPFANMKVKDVATDLGMNQNNANDLFRRKDFPAITFTKPTPEVVQYILEMIGKNGWLDIGNMM